MEKTKEARKGFLTQLQIFAVIVIVWFSNTASDNFETIAMYTLGFSLVLLNPIWYVNKQNSLTSKIATTLLYVLWIASLVYSLYVSKG